ncbi:MAG: S8 family serine peptidase [Niabella sp.]
MKQLFIPVFILVTGITQAQNAPPKNWHLLDIKDDGYPGISLEKAYKELLKNKKPKKEVVVAIIDDGIDYNHPDLQGMIWVNKKEIAGNGKDDDSNGFIDDVHGWSFTGNAEHNIPHYVEQYILLSRRFNNKKSMRYKNDKDYIEWEQLAKKIDDKKKELRASIEMSQTDTANIGLLQRYWSRELNTDTVYFRDIKNSLPATADSSIKNAADYVLCIFSRAASMDSVILNNLLSGMVTEMLQPAEGRLFAIQKSIEKNDPYYFRKQAGDTEPTNGKNWNYGNGNVLNQLQHGTNCAGVIAALRDNELGGNGISNAVKLMALKVTPRYFSTLSEKDIANAIYYAVDNGANIINMSVGSSETPSNYQLLEDALKYAEGKAVLVINSGPDGFVDIDREKDYPSAKYSNNTRNQLFIKVSATNYDSTLINRFSCYGGKTVDLFAPGNEIYTTSTNSSYYHFNGTSSATPVVAGVAALVWSYYPQLTALELKNVLLQSVYKPQLEVLLPGRKTKTAFSSLSISGGIVNAYNALQLAEKMALRKNK